MNRWETSRPKVKEEKTVGAINGGRRGDPDLPSEITQSL